MAKKVVRDPRKPDWWYWPRDWISAIKHRTGWTDEELARQLGISSRTLNYLKKEAYSGRAGMVLRLLSMYQDLTVKGGNQ